MGIMALLHRIASARCDPLPSRARCNNVGSLSGSSGSSAGMEHRTEVSIHDVPQDVSATAAWTRRYAHRCEQSVQHKRQNAQLDHSCTLTFNAQQLLHIHLLLYCNVEACDAVGSCAAWHALLGACTSSGTCRTCCHKRGEPQVRDCTATAILLECAPQPLCI